jgi:isochorismate hydrolase
MSDTMCTDRLARDNTAVLLIDHLPIVATTTATDSMWGPMIPELAAALPADLAVPDRTTVNAWDDPRVADAVRATGRTKLLIAGISTEVCLAFAALSTTAEGFDAYAVIDAAGTFSQTKREAGLLRMQQAGVTPIDYATAIVEILADNADPLAGEVYAALDMPFAVLVGQIAQGLAKS